MKPVAALPPTLWSSLHRRRAGFTLIELLVTLGIIAALVTLAIPVTDRVVHRARAAKCMGNLRGLGSGLQLYLTEHNNVMPTLLTARAGKSADGDVIETVLKEYVEDPECFHCPADRKKLFETTGSSYLWNSLLNGQHLSGLSMMAVITDATRIPVMSDKESFHKHRDVQVNILYADGHVAKDIQFVVDE